MRNISILAAAGFVLALGACATDSANDITNPDLAPSFVKPVPTPAVNVNGPVWVLGSFSFDLDLDIEAAGEGINKHPAGQGSCRDENGDEGVGPGYPYWYNKKGEQQTGAKFCEESETGISGFVTYECTIDSDGLPGTYAFGTGGQGAPGDNQVANVENLNLHSDLIPQEADQFVHYQPSKKSTGATTAKDETAAYATCDDGSDEIPFEVWIDLNPVSAAGNLFGPHNVGDRSVDVSNATIIIKDEEGDDVGATNTEIDELYWDFRSRVPSA